MVALNLNSLFSDEYDPGMSIAEYEFTDEEYFDALDIDRTEDDTFDDIVPVFSLARMHGVKPSDLYDMVHTDGSVFISPTVMGRVSKVYKICRDIFANKDADVSVSFDRYLTDSCSIIILCESVSFSPVSRLCEVMSCVDSLDIDIPSTSKNALKIEFGFSGALQRMDREE